MVKLKRMETLGKLFGTPTRVKLMRSFLFNPDVIFETKEISDKSHSPMHVARQELMRLRGSGFIKRKSGVRRIEKKSSTGSIAVRRKRVQGWVLNKNFEYVDALRRLLTSSKSFEREAITRRFQKVGNVKLLVIAGIFIQNEDSRVDVLIVGSALKRRLVSSALKTLESEAGKELTFSVMSTNEFLYRMDLYDRFIRDILDYPHEKLINKIGLKYSSN